jgi:acyl-coenzyme A synthetase/AMP-(fatty) acid ligase
MNGAAIQPFSARKWAQELVSKDPERCLLISRRKRITAKVLREDVEKWRASLSASGIESGHIVAISAERTDQVVSLYLACLSDGVIPFLIDPRQDSELLTKLLDAVRVHGLFCGESLDRTGFQARLPYLKWIGDKEVVSSVSKTLGEKPNESADSPTFIVHSAGTCGLPRALCHTADAITWQSSAMAAALRLKPGIHLWFTGTLASSAVLSTGMFATLSIGGTLVLDDPAQHLSASSREAGQAILLLAETQDTKTWNAEKWLSVKGNLSGVLTTDCALTNEYATLIVKATDAALWTGFYSAETAGFVTLNTVPGVWPVESAGRPIGGAELVILDAGNQRLSTDIVGRFAVKDCPLPIKTTSLTFKTGNRNEGQEFYLTGDWAKLDTQDFLFCEGCERSVFDKAGFQVRSLPIEGELCAACGVKDAVVFGAPADEIENEVAAVILPKNGVLDLNEVHTSLELQLPRFMIPTKISVTNEIRWTPSGKKIRFGLEGNLRMTAKPVASAPVPVGPIVAESNENEPTNGSQTLNNQTEFSE